ncbi:MAG: hypothetical protein AAF960_28850 [Bacteroidota bacterium]
METGILDNNFTSQNAGISEEAKGYLLETAKWAKFMAIIGFIGVGFLVLVALSIGTFMSTFAGVAADDPVMANFPTWIFSLIYLVMAGIIFMPILYLYRFATKTQQAIRSNDEPTLTEGLKNLKSHYKFYGIMYAIIFGFYGIMLVFALLGGIGAAIFG